MGAARPLVVLDVVGLTPRLLRDAPRLARIGEAGFSAPLAPVFPAVTCPVQSTFLTGLPPSGHGVVANGWYWRDLAQVFFWRQSNALVAGEKVWEAARARWPGFKTAKLFWWFNMYASVEISLTPRPAYPADGRKIPDLYGRPPALARSLQDRLGTFPLFHFWGPAADIRSSRWIAESAKVVFDHERPDLLLVYLPHLDYALQRFGPDGPEAARAARQIDTVAGDLVDHVRAAGADVIVLSEYGIERVWTPVHLNRVLRRAGLLTVQETMHGELLDCGESRAFAAADHQAAHVYVREPKDVAAVKTILAGTHGVARVLDAADKHAWGLAHPRAGELVAVAAPGHWFTYYYWDDDAKAPDFARTVDIHRKPGYDPAELFLDPARPLVKGRIAWNLVKKALGFRYLMDVIPLDAAVVRGSHGRPPASDAEGPVFLSTSKAGARDRVPAAAVKEILLETLAESR